MSDNEMVDITLAERDYQYGGIIVHTALSLLPHEERLICRDYKTTIVNVGDLKPNDMIGDSRIVAINMRECSQFIKK